MSWLDAILTRTKEASSPAPAVPVVVSEVAIPTSKPEIKLVWFQTGYPFGPGDTGSAEAAYYSVADGLLTMRDEAGKPTGTTYRLGKEDPRNVARRLGRDAWNKAHGAMSDFNRPNHYQPLGIA
jgi:hypothetical protein